MNIDWEEFRDIQGYDGLYQVSNLGRVKSLWFNKEKIIKGSKDKDGYLTVLLSKEGKKKRFKIHRLVSEAFIPNPNNYPCINHKDEDKTNNNVDNLEWCTQKYNVNYGTALQRRIANTDWKKKVSNTYYKAFQKQRVENTDWKEIGIKLSKPVLQFTKNNKFVMEWKSAKECEINGYNSCHISECCNGKRKSHKGFIWKFK